MGFFDNLIKSLTTTKEKDVIGIDIGSSSLKVVQLRKQSGKAVLVTYGELALGPYGGVEVGQATNLSAERITETLKDLLRESKVTAKSGGVSIPFSRTFLTLVSLPAGNDDKEQNTIIELEARKYIPAPTSEVQLDWFIVPDTASAVGVAKDEKAPKKKKVDVLLVAVQNEELSFLQQISTGAGIAVSFYEIEIFSTIRAVVDDPIKPVLVIDIGAGSTKTYVVEHGIVMLSHSISIGSQEVTRAIAASANLSFPAAEMIKKEEGLGMGSHRDAIELVFSRIFAEAKRVVIQYETAHQKPISSIVLTGGGAVTKQLIEYAQNLFAIEVRLGDPFAKTEAPAFMRTVLKDIGPEFAVAVGLALRKLDEK